jgi:large conductance mechanosensitive channel
MLKGFKDFIMRGNVVDLAVGVVIGAAFTAVVTQLTKSFLQPLITLLVLLITGKENGIEGAVPTVRGVEFDWIAFVNAVITFLLTAAALYFLVVFPLKKLNERRKRTEEAAPAEPSDEIKLLTEIRDALVGTARVPAQPEAADRTAARD